MTFREKLLQEHPEKKAMHITDVGCPVDYGYEHYENDEINCPSVVSTKGCSVCWDREMPEKKEVKKAGPIYAHIGPDFAVIEAKSGYTVEESSTITQSGQPGKPDLELKVERKILDSGNRRQFESGAVRDIQEGKGRCDLLPLDVVGTFLKVAYDKEHLTATNVVFDEISRFQEDGSVDHLYEALLYGCPFDNLFTMILEVSKHFEEGAKKYGENNWQKGIPVHCYIDSAVRHYLKFLRGDKDEPHDRAVCWNLMCAIWTCKHKPELNEYGRTPDPKADTPKRDYDPVERAYGIAKNAYCNADVSNLGYAMEEILGYLGEALE